MKVKALCDRCKREFEAEEEDVESKAELLCPDCLEDTNLDIKI